MLLAAAAGGRPASAPGPGPAARPSEIVRHGADRDAAPGLAGLRPRWSWAAACSPPGPAADRAVMDLARGECPAGATVHIVDLPPVVGAALLGLDQTGWPRPAAECGRLRADYGLKASAMRRFAMNMSWPPAGGRPRPRTVEPGPGLARRRRGQPRVTRSRQVAKAAGCAPGPGQPGGLRAEAAKLAFAMLPAPGGGGDLHRGQRPHRGVPRPVPRPAGAGTRTTTPSTGSSFSGLTRPGPLPDHGYRRAAPPRSHRPSAIASPGALYRSLVGNAVRYFTSERDGADVVPSVLNRKPANLTDRHASVYADPRFDGDDNLLGTLRKVRRPGQRIRRLVRRRRRLREVRLHRRLRRRPDAARRPGLGRPVPDTGPGGPRSA